MIVQHGCCSSSDSSGDTAVPRNIHFDPSWSKPDNAPIDLLLPTRGRAGGADETFRTDMTSRTAIFPFI
jgi:hypothetical protein